MAELYIAPTISADTPNSHMYVYIKKYVSASNDEELQEVFDMKLKPAYFFDILPNMFRANPNHTYYPVTINGQTYRSTDPAFAPYTDSERIWTEKTDKLMILDRNISTSNLQRLQKTCDNKAGHGKFDIILIAQTETPEHSSCQVSESELTDFANKNAKFVVINEEDNNKFQSNLLQYYFGDYPFMCR